MLFYPPHNTAILCFADSMKGILLLLLLSLLFWEPVLGLNVTYDHRTLVMEYARRVLISATIHFARSTPEVSYDDDAFECIKRLTPNNGLRPRNP